MATFVLTCIGMLLGVIFFVATKLFHLYTLTADWIGATVFARATDIESQVIYYNVSFPSRSSIPAKLNIIPPIITPLWVTITPPVAHSDTPLAQLPPVYVKDIGMNFYGPYLSVPVPHKWSKKSWNPNEWSAWVHTKSQISHDDMAKFTSSVEERWDPAVDEVVISPQMFADTPHIIITSPSVDLEIEVGIRSHSTAPIPDSLFDSTADTAIAVAGWESVLDANRLSVLPSESFERRMDVLGEILNGGNMSLKVGLLRKDSLRMSLHFGKENFTDRASDVL